MFKKKIILFLGYLCFILFIWYNKQNLQEILIISMPLREMYSPTLSGIVFFYFVPFLLGYLTSKKIKMNGSKVLEPLFFSLSLSLLFLIPILIFSLNDIKVNLYLFLTVAYSFLLTPILVLLGFLCSSTENKWNLSINEHPKDKMDTLVISSLILLILLMVALNSIPLILSEYPVGNDVYYHASLSNQLAKGKNIFDSPTFYEGTNYYPTLVHLIIVSISLITHISILDLWRVYSVIFSAIFILLLFCLSSYLTKSYKSGILTTFFVFPWFTLLWIDSSPRLFSVSFLLILIFFSVKWVNEKKKKYLFYSGFAFTMIGLSHLEIMVIAIIILLVFMALLSKSFGKILNNLKVKFDSVLHTLSRISAEKACINLHAVERKFSTILLLYVCVLSYFIIIGRDYYKDGIQIFAEIALSLITIKPIGAISFIVFLFALPAVLITAKNSSTENKMLLSILFPFTSVIFMFTKIWIFYQRYFAEVAYIGFAMLAAVSILKVSKNKTVKSSILLSIVILFFIPLLGVMEWEIKYSQNTMQAVENRIEILEDIKKIDEKDAVILTDPSDFINRYIPAVTGKYIFAANWQISKEQQWAVIGGNFLTPADKADATQRVEFANAFYKNSSKLNDILQVYKVTHVLLRKNEYNRLDIQSMAELNIISQRKEYILLEIMH